MNEPYQYVGTELDLFEHATNWKSYIPTRLNKYIRGDVLEVGAGKGATTRSLYRADLSSWVCLEPDADLAEELSRNLRVFGIDDKIEIMVGTVADIPPDRKFDSILYIDVLEHIEDDAAELRSAASHLRPNGTLSVLAPAHQFLFSEFDAAIGHHRRYDRNSIRRIVPEGLVEEEIVYLDSMGLLASLGNRLILRKAMPNMTNIMIWDRVCIPLSRVLDPLLGRRVGKTCLAVWRKTKLQSKE
ncbi:MAG: class I SAM-dependent methyltransferase [Desulfomonile tiedjei]|nr:class I SAM-dependent methyltransferase [Desulfomonile tiedjei]